ncbi:MAG: NAD(P)/FAD-dependent oxidoreductase [Ignavibacteriales bacterium]
MKKYKIAVVGGGAAGLMAAISAAESGLKGVAVFEGNVRCGTKILMSGGSRCNVTNESVNAGHYFGGSRNFIKNVLNAFGDKDAVKFFNSLGVELKLEGAGKYFPRDDQASTVLNALLKRAKELGVEILLSSKVKNISFDGGCFTISAKGEEIQADKVIITTGGKSYPSTGSDGTGYNFVRRFGHSVNEPFPALTPVLLNDARLTSLSGITLQARLSLTLNGKRHLEMENSLLITHFGLSGPAALNISREVERLKKENIELLLNFIPQHTSESLLALMQRQIKMTSEKSVLNFFKEMLPSNLCSLLFDIAAITQDKKFYSISKEEVRRLVQVFTSYRLKFTGVKGFKQAEVTAGGVPLSEVKYQTMESRLQPGLYLAGEILDVDGLIGGYNFQWAWSTGYIAGKAARGI